jgi:hypothetical protein
MAHPRRRRFYDGVALGLAALFVGDAAGCYGRFRAVNAVYDFNKEASDNTVVRSLLMWALIFIPVYEVAFLADVLVLHVLDFFNGTNKVAATETLPDGSKLELAKLDADTVRVRHVDAAGRQTSVDVVRVGANAGYVRAADGKIVGTVERLPDGRVVERAQ